MGRTGRTRPSDEATASRGALDRRALLLGGLVGAAGIAGVAGAQPASADSAAAPVLFGPAPSPNAGDDDTPALQAALYALGTAGGTVLLPAGTYHLRSLLYVQTRADLRGSGGGYAGPATILQCMTADAGVEVWGGGGVTGDFVVDGNNVALTPFVRGYEGSAVGRIFAALSVQNSAQDCLTCLGSQNDAWYLLSVQNAARDCLVLDQGYGGALFSKCEIERGGRFNLRIDTQVPGGPYKAPSDNVFHQCIVEYNNTNSQSMAYINGGWANKFDHTSFFASAPLTGPVIDVVGGATEVMLEDAAIECAAFAASNIGLRVDYGTGVSLSGTTHFQNFGTAVYVQRSAGAPSSIPWVDVQGMPLYYSCTKRVDADPTALAPGKGLEYFVANYQFEAIQARRASATDLAYTSRVGPATYYTVSETADGRRTWGTGLTPSGDVSFGRRASGVLGVDATHLLATGYGSASTRPDATPAAAGAIRLNTDSGLLEVCDGSSWQAPSSGGAAEHSAALTTSGSFVVPPGVSEIRCRAVGAGGGGGGGGNIGASGKASACYGGSGGGAGMLIEQVLAVTSGETLTVQIGAGGPGGAGAAIAGGTAGAAGKAGGSGASTTVSRGATLLLEAPGGGGGPGAPGSTYTLAVLPSAGGAYGCADQTTAFAPGCGAFAGHSAIPAPGGTCGGAAGGSATATAGGSGGSAPAAPGERATTGSATSPTRSGLAGATPAAAGCGGNGGGAGAKGGAGAVGGAGSGGRVDLWWVA